MLLDELKKANMLALKNHDNEARAILSVAINKCMLFSVEKKAKHEEVVDADILVIIQKTIKELDEEIESFAKASREENVKALKAQRACLEVYLPKMLTKDEIKDIILSLEDKSMPSVMKHFKLNYQGKVDMRLVQEVLKSL